MHSRIFQLERSKGDIDDYTIEEYDFACDCKHEWFIGQVADYVDEDTDRNDDIEWFLGCMEECNRFFTINRTGTEVESITFLPNFKRMYFFERFNKLQQTVDEMNLDDFIDSIAVYRLEQLVEKKFGFYICCEDNLQTMDDFVRNLPNTEITYYFGTTIDYHC